MYNATEDAGFHKISAEGGPAIGMENGASDAVYKSDSVGGLIDGLKKGAERLIVGESGDL
jgi:hypothetical protein